MKSVTFGTWLLAAAALFPTMASASLIGDSVTAAFTNPSATTISNTGVVGPGIDFTVVAHSFDFGADSVAVTVSRAAEGFFGRGGTTSLRLTSLDLGAPITGVSFQAAFAIDVSFTADSVTFSFQDLTPHEGTWLTATFDTQQAVPTPGALALFGFGLAGLAFARRTIPQIAA